MAARKGVAGGIAGLALFGIWLATGCDQSSRPQPQISIWLTIDDGAAATRDTMLVVRVGGEHYDWMALTTDPTFANVNWAQFDTVVMVPVPAVEGSVSVYGRFATSDGSTTGVVSDDIEIDLTARINSFTVIAPDDTLEPGDQVEFNILTGESGVAGVSFGRYLTGLRLSEFAIGYFRRTLEVPDGFVEDSVIAGSFFTDRVGNTAAPAIAGNVFVIRGNRLSPHIISRLPLSGGEGAQVWLHGDVSFVSNGLDHKLHLVDVSSPPSPAYQRSLPMGQWPSGMAGNDQVLLVADGETGVAVVGMEAAKVVGQARISGQARDVVLNGGLAYVATVYSGLYVLNARELERPSMVGHRETMGYGEAVTRNGDIAYMSGTSGLAILDVSRPHDPQILSELSVEGEPSDLVYYEGRLYIAAPHLGLVVIDVGDPTNPLIVSERTDLLGAVSLALQPPHLFVGLGSAVKVVNAGRPEELPVVGEFGGLSGAYGMFVTPQRLYIAAEDWFYIADLYD